MPLSPISLKEKILKKIKVEIQKEKISIADTMVMVGNNTRKIPEKRRPAFIDDVFSDLFSEFPEKNAERVREYFGRYMGMDILSNQSGYFSAMIASKSRQYLIDIGEAAGKNNVFSSNYCERCKSKLFSKFHYNGNSEYHLCEMPMSLTKLFMEYYFLGEIMNKGGGGINSNHSRAIGGLSDHFTYGIMFPDKENPFEKKFEITEKSGVLVSSISKSVKGNYSDVYTDVDLIDGGGFKKRSYRDPLPFSNLY